MSSLTSRMFWLAVYGGLLLVCALSAHESDKPTSEPVSDQEKHSLRRLHRNAVEIFVDRPGFGIRRLELNLDDLLDRPKSLADQNASKLVDPEVPAPKATDKPSHYAVRDMLIRRGGRFPTDDGKETWQVREVYLVGLVTHTKPVVYLVDGNPSPGKDKPKDQKEIPTRDLDTFEKSAFAAIRAGEPLKAEKNGQAMRLLAPIYAGKRCSTCHFQGSLLGGFTYELQRVAYDPEKDGSRTKNR